MTIKSLFSCLQFAHILQGWTDAIATDPLLVPNVLRTPCPFLDNDATPVTHEHDCEDLTNNKPHGTQADALQISTYLYCHSQVTVSFSHSSSGVFRQGYFPNRKSTRRLS